LEHPRERERWFAFQNERVYDRIRRWLDGEGIDPVPRVQDGKIVSDEPIEVISSFSGTSTSTAAPSATPPLSCSELLRPALSTSRTVEDHEPETRCQG
jgi:hypothetical protein